MLSFLFSPDFFNRKSIAFYLALGILFSVAAFALKFWKQLEMPYRLPTAPRQIVFERGVRARQIGQQLAQAGLLRSEWHFMAAAWQDKSLARLQAGEYDALEALSPRDWVERIRSGKRLRHRITIPEGWTSAQIASQLEQAGLVPASDFLQAASNPEILNSFNITAPSAEGYLFPETYLFEKPVSATDAVQVFLREFSRRTASLGDLTHEQVILASIIEKEVRQPEEMRMAAAVFLNRLQKGWTLGSDATLIFALEQAGLPTVPLDTRFASPYNTYDATGVPPGAICNPGLNALAAVVQPATGEWMFFITDETGRTHFTEQHQEHLQLRQEFRRRRNTAP